MPRNLPKKEFKKGQILVGVLIGIAIFAILSHAVFTLIGASYDLVSFNRARITARHLGQEKIEIIRNLAYKDVGTVGGIPEGLLSQEETVTRNSLVYTVQTSVIYIDDPFDNLAPDDTFPTDYKRARVEVSWQGLAGSLRNPIILVTDIASKKETSTTGGTLSISLFDSLGNPVGEASVAIVASSLSPPVNLNQKTDEEGKVTLPGAIPCSTCYEISVSKQGFSSDRTYSLSEVANPSKPHASVIEGQVTQVSFAIDKVGNINLTSVNNRETNFTPLGNVAFRLRGAKTIGTDASLQPVYKFDKSFSTDQGGLITISNLEWDSYQVFMPSPTSWDIAGTNPVLPLILLPDASLAATIVLNPHTDNSLLTIVKNTSQNLIESAYVKLSQGAFSQEKTSGQSGKPDFGQAFFSSLEVKTYNLEATASGFLKFTGTTDVSGNIYEEVVMIPE